MQTAGRPGSIIVPMCDHLCDTTTRYDPAAQILTFLLVCPACGTERVLEARRYAPRFRPTAG